MMWGSMIEEGEFDSAQRPQAQNGDLVCGQVNPDSRRPVAIGTQVQCQGARGSRHGHAQIARADNGGIDEKVRRDLQDNKVG